ncbi:hypothetical protein Mal4_05750 [Maioricimonas rarisocia]|uniref:Carboxypeptidase regulatory-like domain-containing protein n=1 Tax=Maioricimonas rarisocia TaxID=2528026 RepID=A0A517Z1D4_9PLAN|nr:carboxypeptidase-like regulatory domain-containing protein [Maioricimonas rarisocia]QDU36291.1 hypothetical protein Mal4_05750 [Maioricimonas rarisocia]
MNKLASRGPWLLPVVLLLTGAGCTGSSDAPALGRVSGTVTLNGEPLPDATVVFVPEKGRSSIAVTDESGEYSLQYTNDKAGAVVGQHTVRITTGVEGFEGEGGQGREARPERVPPHYNSVSELKEEVASGSSTIDFDLKSDGGTYATSGEGGAKVPDA